MNSPGTQYALFESIEIMPCRQQAEVVVDADTRKISSDLELE
ncbi:MAG: hypothetical protein RLZ81_1702 [Pseudomonadota bacterium]|jgi:hypothetical protein